MKYCIVTPTYSGHFNFIKVYLQSFEQYVEDKSDVKIYFTIDKSEYEEFRGVIAPFLKSCKIEVLFFDEILKANHIYLTPQNLLKKYGKFSFQTLKKFYTMSAIDGDYFLVLDSESSWVRNTNMKKIFQEFYDEPRIYFSHVKADRLGNFKAKVQKNINQISGVDCSNWFLENFMWFYDKKILLDMFSAYGDPIIFVDKVYQLGFRNEGVFEILLYQNYLYRNSAKYGYKLIDVDKECKSQLSPYTYENYYFELSDRLGGEFGLLEQAMMFLTDQNTAELANLFKSLKINILRCETGKVTPNQIDFMNIVRPNILAASQFHEFGVLSNHTFSMAGLKGTLSLFSAKCRESLKRILVKILPAYKVAIQNRNLLNENQRLLYRIVDLENQLIASKEDERKGD